MDFPRRKSITQTPRWSWIMMMIAGADCSDRDSVPPSIALVSWSKAANRWRRVNLMDIEMIPMLVADEDDGGAWMVRSIIATLSHIVMGFTCKTRFDNFKLSLRAIHLVQFNSATSVTSTSRAVVGVTFKKTPGRNARHCSLWGDAITVVAPLNYKRGHLSSPLISSFVHFSLCNLHNSNRKKIC